MDKELSKLYYEGLQPVRSPKNPFTPASGLKYYNSILPSVPLSNRRTIQYLKSTFLMELGQEKAAIDLLRTIVQPALPGDRLGFEIRTNLALGYLRLAERNNCINAHCAGSCVFPIRDDGVYSDPYASQKAIAEYEDLLTTYPFDLNSRWLLNIAYMTLGQYPSKVPARWLIPGLDTDSGAIKLKSFTDMAGVLGLNGQRNQAGGSIVDDFDNDGNLDIVTSSWDLGESMHYYHNNGDGSFTDRSEQAGLDKITGGLNIIQADYNNDGFTDILVIRGAWLQEFGKQPATLLRNNGDGTFTDVTVESGILSFGPSQAAVWADFNNDGWLDLFIGKETSSPNNPHPSMLFINNHDGTFTDVTEEANCSEIGFTKGVAAADYDNDGWPDIFLSGLDGRKILLHNKGQKGKIPQFEDVTDKAGLGAERTHTFPTWFWDYDNDGWPDIFVAGYFFNGHMGEEAASEALHLTQIGLNKMHLYHNNKDGTFTDVSAKVGLDKAVYAMGANFGDLDNDGWLDMYLGTGNPDFTSLIPNRMFKNLDGHSFAEVTASARTGNLQKGHGVAFADLDNDGDQDVFIETGGAYVGDAYYNAFYVNPGQNDNNWISVQLRGVQSNRSAIGAHLAVTFTEEGRQRTVYKDVNSGGSFGCSPLRQEIGIGKAQGIDELIVKWPTTGKVQVFKHLQPRQFLRSTEGAAHVDTMNLKRLTWKSGSEMMKMIGCTPATR
jgi:hypothetical protein